MADTNPYGQQPQGMRGAMPQQGVPMGGMPNQGGYPPNSAPQPSAGGRPVQPGTNPHQPKKNNKKPLIIVLIILLVAAVGAGIWFFASGAAEGGFFDNSAKSGQAPYKTAEEIQAELNRQVEEGMFNISIASVVEFADGTSPGTAYIENVPGNRYNMTVEITLDDSGDVVYQSRGLAPDSYIDEIVLEKDLDAGTYPATATFTAYDTESLEEVGKAAAKVSLVIRN